jgi:hypothetical protein
MDGEIWRWNRNGIEDFSLWKNQVVWQGTASNLGAVVPDGPYLWLAFETFSSAAGDDFPYAQGTLLLLDRASHRTLGTLTVPEPGFNLCVSDRDVWMGWKGIERWNKADLYASLDLMAPAPAGRIAPPSRFASAGDAVSLYDAILRGDLRTVKRLLEKPGATDTVVDRMGTPALTVAVWTGNRDMVKLFLDHHPNLEAVPQEEVPSQEEYPPGQRTLQPTDSTPLVAAASRPDPALTQRLLQAGARPGNAALLAAVGEGYADAAAMLAKAGAPMTGAAELILQDKDAGMADRLLALSAGFPARIAQGFSNW